MAEYIIVKLYKILIFLQNKIPLYSSHATILKTKAKLKHYFFIIIVLCRIPLPNLI